MARTDQILVLDLVAGYLVGVVRNVELLLADDLPGVAFEHTIEHVDLVIELVTVGAFVRVVAADRRGTTDALQARRIQPGGATIGAGTGLVVHEDRSEEHTSELQSLMRISYAVFCLKNKKNKHERDIKSSLIL